MRSLATQVHLARVALARHFAHPGSQGADMEPRLTEAIHEASTLTYADSRKLAKVAIAVIAAPVVRQPETAPAGLYDRNGLPVLTALQAEFANKIRDNRK